MASAELLLNVSYRDIPLHSPATLREVDAEGGFLVTESPMPVGTPLVLAPLDDPEARVAARVLRVVEACRAGGQAAGGQPGMRLVFEAGAERLAPYLHAVGGAAAGSGATPEATAEEWAAHTTLPGFASPAEMATEPMPVPPVPVEQGAGETIEQGAGETIEQAAAETIELEADYASARPGPPDQDAAEEAGAAEEEGEEAGLDAETSIEGDGEPKPEETAAGPASAGSNKKKKSRGRSGRRKKR